MLLRLLCTGAEIVPMKTFQLDETNNKSGKRKQLAADETYKLSCYLFPEALKQQSELSLKLRDVKKGI